jgi:hypothetical protein
MTRVSISEDDAKRQSKKLALDATVDNVDRSSNKSTANGIERDEVGYGKNSEDRSVFVVRLTS